MRNSTPGQKRKLPKRNSKSNLQTITDSDKRQPLPPHNPDYDMQYGCSRATGFKSGGHFWNPPDYCETRILNYNDERWVDVGLCRKCWRHKSRTCPAALLEKIQYVDGQPMYDEPKNRKPKRVPRRIATPIVQETTKPRPKRRT